LRPDTAILQQTVMPLPQICQKLKTTHSQLYDDLMACESDLIPPIDHVGLYNCRISLFAECTLILRNKLSVLIKKDPQSLIRAEIIEEVSFLNKCSSVIHVGDARLGGA